MSFSSKNLAKSGLVAAFYILLTLPFGQLSSGVFFQIRPSEALCLLPFLSAPAVLGVVVGCFVSNLLTSTVLDALLGTLVSLLACILTSRAKNLFVAGLFPVVLNAVFLPLIFLLIGGEIAYLYTFLQILVSETVWVYGLGVPLIKITERIFKQKEE